MQTDCGNGCIDTTTDVQHCGSCTHACQPGVPCSGGQCICPGGFVDCGAGCTSTSSDANNCGACGHGCGTGGVCNGGVCMCGLNYTQCGADCADLGTDHDHCGSCANTCAANERCELGTCQPRLLYHGWTSPFSGCFTNSYDSTAPTNLGGSYPYNLHDSDNCRAWKLAATICTTEPVSYGIEMNPPSWSYNFQCPVSGGFTDPTFGTYCLQMNQYSCTNCYGACNAVCAFHPLSLRNCMGIETNQP
jgi:hypothetical protein